MAFTKGHSVGRRYVKAVEGVPVNAQVGQWVRVPRQVKLSRLTKDNRLVPPSGNCPKSRQRVNMLAFRLSVGRKPENLLTQGKVADTATVDRILELISF